MSYANKRGRAKAFDSGIAGAEFITSAIPPAVPNNQLAAADLP